MENFMPSFMPFGTDASTIAPLVLWLGLYLAIGCGVLGIRLLFQSKVIDSSKAFGTIVVWPWHVIKFIGLCILYILKGIGHCFKFIFEIIGEILTDL